jgi:hypothetical protein
MPLIQDDGIPRPRDRGPGTRDLARINNMARGLGWLNRASLSILATLPSHK